jgi:hypothetical protein
MRWKGWESRGSGRKPGGWWMPEEGIRAVCRDLRGPAENQMYCHVMEASYGPSANRWEVSMTCSDRSQPPCSYCCDGSQSHSPSWWCDPCMWVWWRGWRCGVAGFGAPSWYCAPPRLTWSAKFRVRCQSPELMTEAYEGNSVKGILVQSKICKIQLCTRCLVETGTPKARRSE